MVQVRGREGEGNISIGVSENQRWKLVDLLDFLFNDVVILFTFIS